MNYKEIPIFINSYNRPTFLMQLIYRLHTMEYENLIILDNGSTDAITMAYLSQVPYKTYFIGENAGHNVIWDKKILELFKCENDYYVYTDCDIIPCDDCPDDFMQIFYETLQEFPTFDKCGFGLITSDLPKHYKRWEDVKRWEQQHWKILKDIPRSVGDGMYPALYHAAIDTTFALYRSGAKYHSLNSIRTGKPYKARHLPWYENSSKPFFELEKYRKTILPNESSWENERLNKL